MMSKTFNKSPPQETVTKKQTTQNNALYIISLFEIISILKVLMEFVIVSYRLLILNILVEVAIILLFITYKIPPRGNLLREERKGKLGKKNGE